MCTLLFFVETNDSLKSSLNATSDATSQSDISLHNRNPLSVDRTQVSVFEKTDEVRFGCLLQSKQRSALEAHSRLNT